MHTLLDDYITGMGFVGIEPGVLYHLAPVTQGIETVLSGTGSVVLENVVGDWVDLSLHGRSDQQTTTGAQLFDAGKDKLSYSEHSSVGLTTTYDPKTGWFHVTGALTGASPTFWREENLFNMKAGVQYYFSVETVGENDNVALAESGVRNAFPRKNMSVIQQVDTNANQIYANSSYEVGTEFDLKFRIMITIGDSSLSWEPYTGNQPSPNPDYPQEIKKSGEKTAQLWDGGSFECLAGGSSSGFMKAPQNVTDAIKALPDGVYTITYTPHGDGTIGQAAGKVSFLNAESQHILSSVNTFEMTEDFRAGIASVALYGYLNGVNVVDDFMLNEGSTALPWEPYGHKIETTIDNAGYLERGSDFYNVKKIALKKGRKYRLFSKKAGNSKNAFVFSDGNFTTNSGSGLYSHGYGDLGLKTVNNSGVVSGPCRLALRWNPAVEFTVTEESLYLYFAVNTTNENTDDVWVWTGDGYLTDTPYQEQTITTYTPNGLPGIPVSSGGNYTDETGQQWVTDEIDFGRGKYVQRVKKLTSEYFVQIISSTGAVMLICKNCPLPDTNVRNALCNIGSMYSSSWNAGDTTHFFTQNADRLVVIVLPKNYTTAEQGKEVLEQGIEFYYALATPIETDLSSEEIEAYKALRTYKPTTIITADGGGVEPGITATYQKGE